METSCWKSWTGSEGRSGWRLELCLGAWVIRVRGTQALVALANVRRGDRSSEAKGVLGRLWRTLLRAWHLGVVLRAYQAAASRNWPKVTGSISPAWPVTSMRDWIQIDTVAQGLC